MAKVLKTRVKQEDNAIIAESPYAHIEIYPIVQDINSQSDVEITQDWMKNSALLEILQHCAANISVLMALADNPDFLRKIRDKYRILAVYTYELVQKLPDADNPNLDSSLSNREV